MATPKITAPNPAAWDSDPIEQIYARGTLDRDMSGLSFMLANAAQDRGAANQQQYMQGVRAANQQAMQLSQEEARQAMMLQVLKGSLDLAKNGYLPSDMPALGSVFTDPSATSVSDPSNLANALLRAKIASENAQAAKAGREGGDAYTVTGETDPLGNVAGIKVQGKGKNVDAIQQEIMRRLLASKGFVTQGPGAPPSIDSANRSAAEAQKRRYPGRE